MYKEDFERARERGDLLTHVLRKEVIPALVGVEVSEELTKKAEEEGILLIRVNY